MTKRLFHSGEIIFEEGDPGDAVCRIITGDAEVIKQRGDHGVVVGRAGAGEFVGEMAAVEGRRHSATVRAANELEAELIDRELLLKRISQDHWLAFQLLVRLSDRLRTLDENFAKTSAKLDAAMPLLRKTLEEAEAHTPPDNLKISILPANDQVVGPITENGLVVRRFPFIVGRRSQRNSGTSESVDLLIEDSRPYRLSRAHFSLTARNGSCVLQDLDSTLGTQVNGRYVGRHFGTDSAPLSPGENTVIAGGDESPFAFRILLEKA